MANLVKNMAMDLFSNSDEVRLKMKDADVLYYPDFLSGSYADSLFKKLYDNTPWQQDKITLFGKTHLQPRLTALFGNNGKTYSYSNIKMHPHTFSKDLLKVKKEIEQLTNVIFTTCLLNLYRDGSDSNGWHADNEKELGVNPVIASISLGAERKFKFKHRTQRELKHELVLQHGSLLLMKGATQHHWLHQIPKTKRRIGKRINLTFRVIA
jgi:alkylated DNA repair dioxygenase AlkB